MLALLALVMLSAIPGCGADPVRRIGDLGPPEEDGAGTVGANGNGGPGSGSFPAALGKRGSDEPPLPCLKDAQESADAGAACSSSSFEAQPPPLGLYLMLDRSGSMADATGKGPTKWSALRSALSKVLAKPPLASLSAGAQMFPAVSGGECDAGRYDDPLVAIAPVASALGPLDAAMASVSPSGSTPMAPALSGAIEGARRWAEKHPGATAAAVLATDGQPSSCTPLDAASLAKIAAHGAQAAGGKPAVATFVIGILSADDLAQGALGTLDAIASGGGTKEAILVDPSLDVAEQAASALRQVASRGVACSFALPPLAPGVMLSQVNVRLSSASCGDHRLGYVAPGASCDGDGFRYDVDPAKGAPTRVELCKKSCQRFRSGDSLRIEIGCPTQGWPKE